MNNRANSTRWGQILSPPQSRDQIEELRYWQERIIFTFLAVSIVFGLVVLIPSVALSVKEGLWSVVFVDITMYIYVVFLFIRRSLPFILKAVSIILISYILGLLLIVVTGPFGAGPVWLFFFPVVTGILLEFRYVIISLVVNTVTLSVFGALILTGYYNWSFSDVNSLESWVVISLNFLLLNTITTISVVAMVRGLQSSLSEKKKALSLLEAKNEELRDSNLSLIDEIYAKNKAERSLRKSEANLKIMELRSRDLVNMIPLGYFLIDTDHKIQFLNQKAIELFGIGENHLEVPLDSDIVNIFSLLEREKGAEIINGALLGKESGWTRFNAITRHNCEIPVEVFVTAVFNESDIIGVHGVIVDITDRLEKQKFKNARDIAEKTNEAISDWVSFIAHEIRTPISVPLSYSKLGIKKLDRNRVLATFSSIEHQLLRHSKEKPETFHKLNNEIGGFQKTLLKEIEDLSTYFNRIYASSERLNLLLNELLDLSKLESQQMEFDMARANLLAIVREAAMELEASAFERALELEVVDPEIPLEVECDSFRVGQVIRNLLSNAIKFSPKENKVTVMFERSDIRLGRREYDQSIPALKITVADEGIGIPQDQLSAVFDKFKQSRKSRTGEGTGLGLPICREIVHAHGGEIWVESLENIGTRMHVKLPVSSPPRLSD